MKIKKNVNLDDLSCAVDNEGFWYALTNGYIDEDVLDNEKDVDKIRMAIEVLQEFEALIPNL